MSGLLFLIHVVISFFQEYSFFCVVPFYNLFAALRVIYSRHPSHLFIIFLRLFLNGPRITVRTKMKRVLVFRVLGLSFPDTRSFPYVGILNDF